MEIQPNTKLNEEGYLEINEPYKDSDWDKKPTKEEKFGRV